MKHRELKQMLARELPYPRLTIRADQRIDSILSSLPEKGRAPASAEVPSSWKAPDGGVFVPAEPARRSRAGAALKWALACVSLVLAGLVALDFLAPQTAESLPVLGGVFRAVNERIRGTESDPAPQPGDFSSLAFSELPVEDNQTTLLKAELSQEARPEAGGGYILECTAKLPYLGVESWSLLSYEPNCWSPDGMEATLHFPDGVFTYAGESDVQPSDTASVDGEKDGPTITWRFGINPKYLDGPVVLAIPERNWYVEDEESSGRRIVAEFTLDLSTLRAAVTEYYKTGYFGGTLPSYKVTPEEALAAPRNGEFTRDWYAQQPIVIPGTERQDGGSESGYKVVFFQRNINTEGLGPDTGANRHEDWDSVTLNCYVDESLTASVSAYSQEELNKKDILIFASYEEFADESSVNSPGIHTREGSFLDMLADPELAGGDYRRLVFFIPSSALGMEDNESFRLESTSHSIRFELVDGEGGVIFTDALGAAEAEYEQMAEAYHALCRVESGNAVAEQVACSPLPVEDNGTTLTSIARDGSTVTVTAEIPYMGRVRDSLEANDYFNYTLFGATAQLTRFGEDSQFADSTQVEGEQMEDLVEYPVFQRGPGMEDRLGETRTVSWTFQNVKAPEDGQLLLTLYERPESSEGGIGAFPGNRITAEFVINLNTYEAAPADYAEFTSFVKAEPEEVFNTSRTGEFSNGWYATEPVIVDTKGEGLLAHRAYVKAVFYQKDVELQSVSDEFYTHPDWETMGLSYSVDGQWKGYALALPRQELKASGTEFTVGDGEFLGEPIATNKWYETESGAFYDNAAFFSGTGYRRLVFAIPATALGLSDDPAQLGKALAEERISLVLGSWQGELPLFPPFSEGEDAAAAARRQKAEAQGAYARLCGLQADEPVSFQNRFAVNFSGGDDSGVLHPTPNLDGSQLACTVDFFADTREDLPWTLKITAAGDNYEFPLHPADTTIKPPESEGMEDYSQWWTVIASGPEYLVARRSPAAGEIAQYGTGLKQCYQVTLYQNGIDGKTYDWSGCTWKIVDHQTGETIYDTSAPWVMNKLTGVFQPAYAAGGSGGPPANSASRPLGMCSGYPTPDPNQYQ